MKLIAIYGAGYVGLVTGICLASLGHSICCMDIDKNKIDALKNGKIPIYEPGLSELLQKALQNNCITFTDDIPTAVNFSSIQMIAVGTPPGANGEADLSQVNEVATAIGQHSQENKFVVVKSTVPVGTADKVLHIIQQKFKDRNVKYECDVASNPEFLREGDAVKDFLEPDRIIIGVNNTVAEKNFKEIYKPLIDRGYFLISMQVYASELTKYVANAFLATKISFMNEISRLSEKLGANIHQIKQGLASDSRISKEFLNAGCGFGGSCFPKDLLALQNMARKQNLNPVMIDATLKTNAQHQRLLFDKVMDYFSGDISGRIFAVWGLAFKPNTDDIRFASSRVVMELLWEKAAFVQAYDPIAMDNIKAIYGDQKLLKLCNSAQDALINADALIILTEWNEFLEVDLSLIKKCLNYPIIFDGRNIYDLQQIKKAAIHYVGVGCSAKLGIGQTTAMVDEVVPVETFQAEIA